MQTLLRDKGPSVMPPDAVKTFIDVHAKGELVDPYDAGHVAAALALQAPQSLSGAFVNWAGDECKGFRRK